MKIGICTSLDKIKEVEEIGFDYIEPTVSGLASMTEEEFDAVYKQVLNSRIKPDCFNVLFPAGFHLIGKDKNEKEIEDYLEKAFSRVSKLNGKIVVFGSGGARKVPEGYTTEDAFKELVHITKLIGGIAQKYNIIIVVEPLNISETNIINTVIEGKQLVDAVNMPSVSLLADYYHMFMDKEDLNNIVSVGKLMHTHIARGEGRLYPLNKNEDKYVEFFDMLHKINYNERVSIEGKTDNFTLDATNSLKLLRTLV